MAYGAAQINKQIEIITGHLPRVMSLTTDVAGNLADFSQSTLVVQRFNGKSQRIDLTPHRTHEDRTIDRFAAANGLSLEVAATIYWAARELFKLNPRGSWCAAPDPQGSVLKARELRADPGSHHAFVVRTVLRLAELLPAVDCLEVDACTKAGVDGRQRRRTWIRFYTGALLELAAIDTGSIATHVHDGLVPEPSEFLQANQLRLAVWAKQLQVDLEDAPEALHLCGLLSVQLSFGSIRFD